MSSKGIHEADGKRLLASHLQCSEFAKPVFVNINEDTNLEELPKQHPWLLEKVLQLNLFNLSNL